MDDFLEQTLNMSAWSESNAAGKVEVPWEYNSMKLVENNPRLFTTSSMPSGMGCHGGTDCSSSTPENFHFSSSDDSFFPSSQPSMILELGSGGSVGSSRSPGVLAAAMAPFFLSAGTGSGGSEGSGVQSRLGILNPLSLTLAQGSLDTYPNEARLLRIKLPNDEETRPSNNIGTLTNFCGGHVVRSNDRQRFIPQNYGGHTSSDRRHLHSEASGVMATPTQTPTAATQQRPRVRARRGQATDPHSIAERQRRERIAERLRKLQELVPSCNKTDKAAMLDQILDYLKFLQLQVKVLSMSRFGGAGAGAVVPLVAEVPNNIQSPALSRNEDSEICSTDEGLAVTERQVAKLMEQDMASALQYLQSKGLCVMPLSLATATSGTSGSIIISNSVSSPVINRTL